MDLNQRSAGVLLHLSSLPGPHGIGDLGPDAFHFVDWLASAGQRVWQVLPTTPIGPGDSPYQGVSAFAGSPLMVALEPLVEQGWLAAPALPPGGFDAARVDYGRVAPWRLAQLRAAAAGFFDRAAPAEREAFAAWCAGQTHWLADYALFMALENAHAGASWWHWPAALREREANALADARRTLAAELRFWQFVQWCFDTQWAALRAHANARGVSIMGDLPIFVAHHSADCWARPDLYELDAEFQPAVVSGVPPDAFSADGQRWGNPLYRWDRMAAEGYAWWVARMRRELAHADAFRIDHFRGFAAHWEVPATSPTAIAGRWVPGPGRALFDALARALGPLPIIAEDLGVITPDVTALREACGFPGMRILQFAFGDDARNPYLPHRHTPASVIYTGTHDNDTTLGWWQRLGQAERAFAAIYLGVDRDATGSEVCAALIRAAYTSVANLAVVPMQDVLRLDGTHRMNLPGAATGQWAWRFDWGGVGPAPAHALARLAGATGRGAFAAVTAP
ncbi:MAG TPA: 4-alpha-glucanotransferase [Burkholderiaceae bacterium]|nr:4-alpha-glucanotransferase [Burkholderiaceae bacterium]